ncbi:putative sugar kinase YdjE [Synergistales bacterium]|nr:putative sugar kinase YdjE [Synergistales bacterium]
MFDVAAIGELLIDFTPSGVNDLGIPLFAQNPGGAPANVLAMNSRLGGSTAFIGKVGKDNFGSTLRRTLTDSGIDVTGLVMDEGVSTTLAFVHLNDQGDRSFSFYRKGCADIMLTSGDVNRSIIDDCRIFHFGSVSLTDDPCRSAIYDAVEYAVKKGKIISYDPNYRPFLWSGPETARKEIMNPMPSVNILKVSEEEMTLLTGQTDFERGAEELSSYGPAIVIVTLGEKGAFYRCKAGCGALPAYNVKTVDTTGAGDAFLGALHFCLRKDIERIHDITKDELEHIVRFANAAGGLTTTKRGAIPAMPSIEDIRALAPM